MTRVWKGGPSDKETRILAVIITLFSATPSAFGYLVWFLSNHCEYELPYTLEGCVSDMIVANKWRVVQFLLSANLVFFGVMYKFYFVPLCEAWIGGERKVAYIVTPAPLIMFMTGLGFWVFWPIIDVIRYAAGATDVFMTLGRGPASLMTRAILHGATQPFLYAAAGLIGGVLYLLALAFVGRELEKKQ